MIEQHAIQIFKDWRISHSMEVISNNIIIEIQPIKNTANDSLLSHGLLDKRKLISEQYDFIHVLNDS